MPHARSSDPDTSHAAACSMSEEAARHHALIIDTMTSAGVALSAEEIADRGHFADKVAVCKRFAELERAGCIIKTSDKATNRSGRKAYRYTVA